MLLQLPQDRAPHTSATSSVPNNIHAESPTPRWPTSLDLNPTQHWNCLGSKSRTCKHHFLHGQAMSRSLGLKKEAVDKLKVTNHVSERQCCGTLTSSRISTRYLRHTSNSVIVFFRWLKNTAKITQAPRKRCCILENSSYYIVSYCTDCKISIINILYFSG